MQSAEFEVMLQNVDGVDAPTLEDLRYAFAPHGQSAVALSPNFIFIISHVLKGRPVQQVSELLEREKREYISPLVIRDYVLNYIPQHLIQKHVALRSLTKHRQIDELSVMEQLLALQYNRVATIFETAEPDLDSKENSRREIDLCRAMCKDLADLKLKTGKYKGQPVVQQVVQDNRTQVAIMSSGPGNQVIDVREAANVIRVLKEVDGAPKELWEQAFAEVEQEEKALHAGHNGAIDPDQDLADELDSDGEEPGQGNSGGFLPGE